MILRWTFIILYSRLSLKFSPILFVRSKSGSAIYFSIFNLFLYEIALARALVDSTATIGGLPHLPNDLWPCDPSWPIIGLQQTCCRFPELRQSKTILNVLKLCCPIVVCSRSIRGARIPSSNVVDFATCFSFFMFLSPNMRLRNPCNHFHIPLTSYKLAIKNQRCFLQQQNKWVLLDPTRLLENCQGFAWQLQNEAFLFKYFFPKCNSVTSKLTVMHHCTSHLPILHSLKTL